MSAGEDFRSVQKTTLSVHISNRNDSNFSCRTSNEAKNGEKSALFPFLQIVAANLAVKCTAAYFEP